jgi:hypothetical protein
MPFDWGPPERPEETLYSGRPGPPSELGANGFAECCSGCPTPSYKCPEPGKCPVRVAAGRTFRFQSIPPTKRSPLLARLKEKIFR